MSQRQGGSSCSAARDHRLERPAVGWRVRLRRPRGQQGVARRHRYWVKEEYSRGHRAARLGTIFRQPQQRHAGRCAGWQGCVCRPAKATLNWRCRLTNALSQSPAPATSELPDAIQHNPRRMVGQNYEPIDSGAKPFKFRKDAKDAAEAAAVLRSLRWKRIRQPDREDARRLPLRTGCQGARHGEAGKPESADQIAGGWKSAMADTGFEHRQPVLCLPARTRAG